MPFANWIFDPQGTGPSLGPAAGIGGVFIQRDRGNKPSILDGYFGCVGELRADDLILGSCTVLPGGHFALAAAHTVRFERKSMEVRVRKSADSHWSGRKVMAIRWQSGEFYDFATPNWHTIRHVEQYRNEQDRLVLLELIAPLDEDDVGAFPTLPGGVHPFPGDVLIVAGWGEDAVGNHPDSPWAAVTRCRLPVHSWRGVHSRLRSDLFNGMPRAGDSGGPIFYPPLHDPLPPNHLRLVGVHSGRIAPHGMTEEVAAYLPIDPLAEAWISGIAHLPGLRLAAAPSVSAFKLRNRISCHVFPQNLGVLIDPNDPHAVNGFRRRLRAKGSGKLLKQDSVLSVTVDNDDLVLTLERPGGGAPLVEPLHRAGIGGAGHWYTNHVEGVDDKATFYLFLKTSPVQAPETIHVHIEAFLPKSRGARPSADCIGAGLTPVGVLAASTSAAADEFLEDQDDEGNGHDPP
jgi:hypothetical protein